MSSVDIVFNEGAAVEYLIGRGVWPADGHNATEAARGWWLELLRAVTGSVNEHGAQWHEEAEPGDRYTEFSETAATQAVAQARKTRGVLRVLDASEVGSVFGPGSDEVEQRLLPLLGGGDGTEGAYRHAGEDEAEYAERLARLRQRRREECAALLELGSFTEMYLVAAAVSVAGPWCEQVADAWVEANPEDEDWDWVE